MIFKGRESVIYDILIEEMNRLMVERDKEKELIKRICNAKENTPKKGPDYPQEFSSKEEWVEVKDL